MNNVDAVVIGSALTVIVATVIVVYLGFKVKKLMDQGSDED
jgi:putative Ca2+/H+ antiporter (TMEM165/GDT1 family)